MKMAKPSAERTVDLRSVDFPFRKPNVSERKGVGVQNCAFDPELLTRAIPERAVRFWLQWRLQGRLMERKLPHILVTLGYA